MEYWLAEMKRRLVQETTSVCEGQTCSNIDASLSAAYAQRAAPDTRDDQLMDELERSIRAMPLDYEDRVRLISTISAIRAAGVSRGTEQRSGLSFLHSSVCHLLAIIADFR